MRRVPAVALLLFLITGHTLANGSKFLAGPPLPEAMASAEELLEYFLAASSTFGSFEIESRTVVQARQGELPASFRILFAGPDRYRESTLLPCAEIVTGFSGQAGWANTPGRRRARRPHEPHFHASRPRGGRGALRRTRAREIPRSP